MTRGAAKRHIKALLAQLGRPLTKTEKDAVVIAYKSMEKLDAIRKNTPPTDDWERYVDKLYDIAYMSGYNDAKNGEKPWYGKEVEDEN